MYAESKNQTLIVPNLSSLLKLPEGMLGEALLTLHALYEHKLFVKQSGTYVELGTKRDSEAKRPTQVNPFSEDDTRTSIPPILALLQIGLSQKGITIRGDGIYMINQDTGTSIKIAKYVTRNIQPDHSTSNFKTVNLTPGKIDPSTSGFYKMSLTVSHPGIMDDFKRLDEFRSAVNTLRAFGGNYSFIVQDTWIRGIDWECFRDEEWCLERTRALTDEIARYTLHCFGTTELRNERNCFFAARRAVLLLPEFKHIREKELMATLNLLKEYLRSTGH